MEIKRLLFVLASLATVIGLFYSCEQAETNNLPLSVTVGADNVSTISAVLKGKANLSASVSADLMVGFQYSKSAGILPSNSTTVEVIDADANYNYSAAITSLEPATQYFFRSFVRQNGQDTYGETKEFKTNGIESLIETKDATDVESVKATLNAKLDLTDVKFNNLVYYGFYWGASEISQPYFIKGEDITDHAFTAVLNSVSPNKQYWYKAVVNLDGQIINGEVKTFTTDNFKGVKRLTQCGDQWDVYYFTYNEDGTIKDVKRNKQEAGAAYAYERTWSFTWNLVRKIGTAKYVKEGEEKGDWVFTLGDNGFLSTWANEWGDTWRFTYNQDNYLTNIKRIDNPGRNKANCVWEGGDLIKWSRFKDDGTEEWKKQTFLKDENVGGIFVDASDKAGVDRWIFELGFCGKPSAHLLDRAAWEGAEAANYFYEKDAEGFVTKVSKVIGTNDPELYYYVWNVVE